MSLSNPSKNKSLRENAAVNSTTSIWTAFVHSLSQNKSIQKYFNHLNISQTISLAALENEATEHHGHEDWNVLIAVFGNIYTK